MFDNPLPKLVEQVSWSIELDLKQVPQKPWLELVLAVLELYCYCNLSKGQITKCTFKSYLPARKTQLVFYLPKGILTLTGSGQVLISNTVTCSSSRNMNILCLISLCLTQHIQDLYLSLLIPYLS